MFGYKYILSSSDSSVGVGTLVVIELSQPLCILCRTTADGDTYVIDSKGQTWYFYDYKLLTELFKEI